MFSFAGAVVSAKAGEAQQGPVPPPTCIDFPTYSPSPASTGAASDRSKKNVFALFAALKKPTDVRIEHLEALGVDLEQDLPLTDLFSGQYSYLPPEKWNALTATEIQALPHLSPNILPNGQDAPGARAFWERKVDLVHDNDDIFRAIARQEPRPGRKAARPGSFYKFWQGLELMSQYWDDHSQPAQSFDDMDIDNAKETVTSSRRTSGGKDMPEQFREDTVKAFVEPIAWLFGCQVSPPRAPPRVALQSALIPVRVTQSVFRVPSDRQKARQGLQEGPLFGIQCRVECTFCKSWEEPGSSTGDVLDLLRETGIMLLLAQERAREGKTEVKPGEGKWYTTTPRWGGGPGGDIGDAKGNTDDAPREAKRSRTRKESAIDVYKRLSPGRSTWDRRVTYQRIGTKPGSSDDDIFLVSSIYHHISILHVRVSNEYLSFLETGKSSSSPPPRLRLRRSRWLDLFKPEDRLEGMRGIWAILAYLNRLDIEKKDTSGQDEALFVKT